MYICVICILLKMNSKQNERNLTHVTTFAHFLYANGLLMTNIWHLTSRFLPSTTMRNSIIQFDSLQTHAYADESTTLYHVPCCKCTLIPSKNFSHTWREFVKQTALLKIARVAICSLLSGFSVHNYTYTKILRLPRKTFLPNIARIMRCIIDLDFHSQLSDLFYN